MTRACPIVARLAALLCAALLLPAQAPAQPLTEAEANAVAADVVALVDSHYVFPEKTGAITEALQSRMESGRYRAAAACGTAALDSLAAWLTADL